MWKYLISDENPQGPIHVGALEYDDLRIEAGHAGFKGQEITDEQKGGKTSPLELQWQQDTISTSPHKGCYLGQEGVASILKNIRGPPRLLYSVVFDDDENVYETQSRGDGSKNNIQNLTRPPKVGDALYVLGSNEEITVGTVTSVARPGGTGEPCTVGLALVRRADSIRRKMTHMELEIHRDDDDSRNRNMLSLDDASSSSSSSGSGMIEPPPLDPLDGLEVIIGGSFTVGKLRMIPSRRLKRGTNMFDSNLQVEDLVDEDRSASTQAVTATLTATATATASTTDAAQVSKDDDLKTAKQDAVKAQADADASVAEAKRKADKMEMLKKRAADAMAKKKAAAKKEQE
jgi:hypothetical protein